MSQESFIGVMVLIGVMFLAIIKAWFAPSSFLRPHMPHKQQVSVPVAAEQYIEDEQEALRVDVEIVASEYSFTPANFSLPAGYIIRLTYTNKGEQPHDLVVRVGEQKYATGLLEPGEGQTLEFTVDTPGQYTFYSSVPGDRDKGMEGVLAVE